MLASRIRACNENGSFALEFALVAPCAVAVLALVLMGGSLAIAQVRAHALAASTAVALARGASSDTLTEKIASEGFRLGTIDRESGVVCAVITDVPAKPGRVPELMSLIPAQVSARACCPEDPA